MLSFGRKYCMLALFLFLSSFFQFCGVFTGKEKQFRKWSKINLILAIVFLFSLLNNFFIQDIKPRTHFSYWPVEVGWLYYPFLLWFALNVIFAFLLLRKALKEKELDIVKKNQTSIIYWGTLTGFAAGSINFLLDFGIIFPPYHNFFVGTYLIFTALAITKYHLFGIRVILTEILVGAVGIILLTLPFLMPTSNLKILTAAVFLLFCLFAYYLIKATHEEAKRREEAERLAIQESALRVKAEEMRVKAEQIAQQEVEMRQKAEKIAKRERKLKEEIGKIALQQKKLAEIQREIAEEKTKRMERIYHQFAQKELEMVELKKKIAELEEKLKMEKSKK